jgi:hypothetical protein
MVDLEKIVARWALIACALMWGGREPARAVAEEVDYQRDVKPILHRHCAGCHGVLQSEGGLRVDVVQHLRRGGESGAVIIPGDPAASRLMQAVTGVEGVSKMPQDGPALSPAEIDVLRRWIAGGAIAADEPEPPDPRRHWSFLPPSRPQWDWSAQTFAGPLHNGIDLALAHAHARHGLTAVPAADPATLLRRLYWDLVGVPPTPEELAGFLADSSPDRYERKVDELLASPRYGERWARHWMDVWRYSDWYGYGAELRNSSRHIWRWRDWIVESLNADKPYDQMLVEMLAADELAPLDADALRATGFLTRHYYKFNRDVWLDSVVEHTGKAFLGLTLNCARCHHHKYDPIVQQQYYEFRAIFEPYDVRIDRVPGVTDIQQDGLARVYDARLEQPTFLYERGNDKHPRKDKPLSPQVPEFLLGAGLAIEPLALPAEARFPGLQGFWQADALRVAETALQQAQAAVATAESAWHSAQAALHPFLDLPADAAAPGGAAPAAREADRKARETQLAVDLARQQVFTAEAQLAALRAAIAADVARYSQPPAENADALIRAAAQAQLQHAVHRAQADLVQAELNVVRAAAPPSGSARPKPLSELLAARDAARQKLQEAEKALTAGSTAYTSLSDVYPSTSTGRRLALARWITDRKHPLTPRVAVNHVWQRHFGEPLVETMFDFGRAGKPPALPELLDWLTLEFLDSGWSLKHLHRLMVTSAAYRRASTSRQATSDTLHRDPDNRYWWRTHPRRLEAEAVRDALLYAADAADERLGGPELDATAGLTTYRRSLYYRHAPEKSMEFLDLFDGPSANECYRRSVTVTPQQALALHNSSLSLHMAERSAARLTAEVGSQPEHDAGFVIAAFRRTLSREPSADELRLAVEFLQRSPPTDRPAAAWRMSQRTHVLHVLFNHNDFVTVR